MLHLLGEASPQPWLKVEVRIAILIRSVRPNVVLTHQNRDAIRKVITLFVPGILPEHLNLPPRPTSATTNPNLPVSIPLPSPSSIKVPPQPIVAKTLFGEPKILQPTATTDGKDDEGKDTKTSLPFLSRTFSHACPTRAPGDPIRMHSVLSAFFQGPVTADEKKRRGADAAKGANDSISCLTCSYSCSAAKSNPSAEDPSRYLLTPAQMLENQYPQPSYMPDASVDVDGSSSSSGAPPPIRGSDWVETPNADYIEAEMEGWPDVYAIDCEMVCAHNSQPCALGLT